MLSCERFRKGQKLPAGQFLNDKNTIDCLVVGMDDIQMEMEVTLLVLGHFTDPSNNGVY